MEASPFDTIVAPITGVQRAAVAVVRVSGADAWHIAENVFSPWPRRPEARKALYGRFRHGDDGLALPFEQGASYTGEASVEFSIHGSPASVRALLRLCCQAGARPAQPGEFTLRAFQNGRIDLTQAEGVRDTVEALTDAQLRAASSMREGWLCRECRGARQELLGVLASIEASADFSEEVGDLDRTAAAARLAVVQGSLLRLLTTAASGRVLREGLTIAIVGLPNAGKSSLLNALVGEERAIVTDLPGTTRDTVEELVDLGGVPCRLVDTAGLRETDDRIESLGVERARKAAQRADVVWYLFDSSVGWTDRDEALLQGWSRPTVLLAGKCDLARCEDIPGSIRVSSVTREGLDGLIETVQRRANVQDSPDAPTINSRHEPLLTEAEAAVRQAIETLESDLPDDLAAVHLQQAVSALGQVTGETAGVDMVERIFHDFCIGK